MPTIDLSDSTIRIINELKSMMEEKATQAGAPLANLTPELLIHRSVAYQLLVFDDKNLTKIVADYFATKEGMVSITNFGEKHGLDFGLHLK